MDHFPIPAGGRHVLLQYLAHQEYDNGTFADYPERQGWSSSELSGQPSSKTGERYGGRSAKDINSFFQTWLFFGVLIRAFRCLGIKVTTDDFVTTSSDTGNTYISTKSLNGFIEKWKKKKSSGNFSQTYDDEKKFQSDYLTDMLKSQTRKNHRQKHHSPVESVLADHRKFILKYLDRDSGVGHEVIMAAVAVQHTMSYWASGLHHSDWDDDKIYTQDQDYTSTTWMLYKMMHSGWCPAESAKFMRDHRDIGSQYYLAGLASPRYEDDHSKCNEQIQRCGYKSKNWTYKTQHVREGCKCSIIEAPKDVIDIIRDGHVPLITYHHGRLKAVPLDSHKNRYVAISHVWSDGLGNEKHNALPKCQMELMQSRVEEADYRRRHTGADNYERTSLAGFWMDTLCVPVAKEHRALRDSQIQKMRKIYKGASAVLVLDKWVMELPRSAGVVEKSARLYASNWQHRLWTCQEGVMAINLYFQLKDGPQTIKEIEMENEKNRDDKARSRLPERVLGLIPAFNDLGISEMDIEYRYKPVIDAIRPRATTKAKDETICIATLLDVPVDKLLQITKGDNDELCEKRMAKLIDLVGTWSQGSIFTTLPRLSIPGYRWAPKSFLGTNLNEEVFQGGDTNIDRDMTNWDGKPMIGHHGLLVAFPSYKLGKIKEAGNTFIYMSNGEKHYKVVRDKGDFKEGKEYVLLRSPGTKPIQAVVCVRDGVLKKSAKLMPWDVPKLKYVSHAVMVSRTSERKGNTSYKYMKKDEWIIG